MLFQKKKDPEKKTEKPQEVKKNEDSSIKSANGNVAGNSNVSSATASASVSSHHFLDKPTGLKSTSIPKIKFQSMDLRKLFKMPQKNKPKGFSVYDKKKLPKRRLVDIFFDFLNRTGYEHNPRELIKKITLFDVQFMAVVSIILLVIALINGTSFGIIITMLLSLWTVVFAAVYLFSIAIVLAFLDIILFQHTKQIEENLPDFLQLASANISAGMTVDRALWFAVRPKFGILAREIEDVAKSTLAGEELEKALLRFAHKYNSRILRESINLLIAGINSGGEIAGLLNKIAGNIKETSLMKKEIAASVTTYVIFIGTATVVAAPILFALSTELLSIIQKITSSIQISNTAGMSGLFSFNFSSDSISVSTFQTFSMIVLAMSSFFSAAIISAIRKGNITEGLKLIPIFICISIVLYFLAVGFFRAILSTVIK